MATVLATPGVYIEENSAFASSVVPVGTAIPIFLGYTQKAARGTKSLSNVPTRISSFAEFEQFFGGAPKVKFETLPEPNSKYIFVSWIYPTQIDGGSFDLFLP